MVDTMVDSDVKTHTYYDDPKLTRNHNKMLPKPDEIYLVPTNFLSCLLKIAPKLQSSGAWWSVSGDLAEAMQNIHVRPQAIEIMTNAAGMEKISTALSEYSPTSVVVKEQKLEREAEPDNNKYPLFERYTCMEFTANGAKVTIQSDYQLKVGDWEWGDAFFFDPVLVNVSGTHVPVMPLALKSELYLTLGWFDRLQLISDANSRARAAGKASSW